MSENLLRKPHSMGSLLPPNYTSDEGMFDLNMPRIRPAWLMNESIRSLDSKFPMVPAPTGSIIFYTTPLAEKLCQQSKNREFDLTDPLRPSLSYNCLHDEHLQVYFKSNDIRKRLLDDGFITNDGYVKCSLKEFNEYRQWIRKLKLDELHQARRQDEKQIEDAKKERLERIAMERDPELLEIMKRRREKRREQAKIHHQHIKKEQERVRKLEEIDRQRREKFLDMRMKNRDRIQIKRDLERERLRKTKSDNERQEHKIKLRIVRKMNKDNDERLKHLEERKNEAKQVKAQKLEEQWLRRKSWSVEHHEHQNQLRQFQNQEFQHNVEERNAKVAKQRRLSLVSYQEIAEANRRAFETQLENAEVFLAKLNHKKAEELKEWRKKFEAMQKLSMTTLGSGPNQSIIIKNIKKRARRQSAWDLESCLLKDLGIAEKEMSENAYSKIGVISRIDERNFAGDNKGALGSLIEDDDAEGQQHNKEFRFSIPTIVESLASIQEQSSDESDSDSDYCPFNNIPSVFRFKSHHDLQPISDSPELKPNSHIPEGEMRVLVKDYVQGVLQQSADVLGVDIKFQERLSREEIPRINDVKRIPELKTVELDTDGSNMRSKVKEYLSSILDKVEDKIQVTIKRPPEYEKIKQDREPSAKTPVETSVDDIIDSKLHYHNKRNVIRLYLCKILEDAAEQSQVNVTFPPQYQSFAKRLHRPRRKAPGDKGSSSDAASQMAGQHTVVLRAIACGTVVLESAERKASMTVCSPDLVQDIKRTASEIETMKNKYDKVRAKRLFHENLIMIATRTVVEALHHAVVTVRSQRRNSDFFMSDLPNLRLKDDPSPPSKEQTVLLKRQRSQHRRESIEANQIEAVPREIDFLSEVSAKKGGKNMSCQATTQTNKKSKKELSKFQEPNTHSANKKTGSEGKPIPKTGKQTGTKKADKKKDTQKTGDLSENSEETGKLQGKVEQQIGANNQKASSSDAIEVVVTETENSEARIQEIGHGSENAGDPKIIGDDLKGTMEHLSDENQTHNERILSNGGQLGDDGMEAPVSTLSMASPSLPNVTPEPSGFGPPPDEVRSGAVPPITEASNADRGPAGSPSSAIFRMISMRETRESCDLSPKSSYVILPTLTSSEGALINTRMAQLLSNDHSKTRGLETSSRGHLPALSPSPSNEDHFTDHTNEPVRLPSVPSVESCPSRSPTPVRSLSRSSQVELPHIDGSSTSLVGNVEQASVKTDEPSNSTGTKAPQNTAKPSKPIAATKVPGKPTPSSKTTPGSKLQPGKPPVRAKSEISRKQVAAPTFPPRKGGQVRSSVALVSAKQPATPTHQKKSGETTDPAKQKKQEKQGKPADTASPQDRPAKSKSMGEAMATARRNSQGGSHNKVRRPSDVAFHTSSIAELEKNFAKPANRKSSTTVKSHLQFGSTQEKSNAPTSNDAHGIAKPSGAKKSLQDVKAKPARDAHAKSTNAVHTKSAPDDNKAKGATPSNIDHTKPEKDDNNLSVVKGHAKSTQNARVKSTQDTHSKPTQDAHAKSTKMAKTEDRPDKTTENTESKHKKDAEGLKNFDKNATAKPNKDNQSKDSQKSNLTGLSMKELKEKSKTVSATVTTAKESQDTSKPSAHQEEAIVSAPESESDSASRPSTSPKPTQSPSPKPTQSPSPKPTQGPSPKPARASSSPTSQGSREEDPEKPQSMRGALIMSPDVEELLRNGSPGESQKSSSHTILENTESETEFFRTQNQIKKWDDSVAEPLVDETAENNARKKSRPRGTKPNVTKPKPKKPLVKKAKQSEDEAKVSDSKDKVGDGATKVSDSKAKIIENKARVSDTKGRDWDGTATVTGSSAKTSDSKSKVSDAAQIANSDSKNSRTSIAGKGKNSFNTGSRSRSDSKTSSVQSIAKPEVTRRSSLSVSFSSKLKQLPEVQKERRESVGRLTKRRSSVKVTKKASSKEIKRRRSTKSSTEVVAKVDSNRKVSNISLSKAQGKSRKKSLKDVVANKTKSKENTKSEDTQMTNVDDTTKTRMNNAQETHTNNAQETHEADSQETRVEDPQSTHLDETHETRVEDTDKGSVKEPQETCLVESQENSQEVAQDTLDTDSDEARVDDSQGTREGADDGNLKSGSDREVVVQVYVPDEGQSDSHSDGLVSENTSQESRDKVEVTLTGNENDGGVTKIDLKPWEDPGKTVKKTSSRRAFGDNVVEKNLVNIIPRNSLDVIKGIQLTPGESKVSANRSFHSKPNHPRAPTAPKQGPRVSRRNPPDAKPLKVSNFELPPEGQGGVGLKPTPHGNKPQMSMHRLASKMSTNLEKVDEGSALETGRPSAPDKFGTAFNITGVKAKSTSSGPGTDKICETQSSVEKTKSEDDNVEKTAEKVDENVEKKGNEKTEATLKSSNKSLQLLMKVSGVCIDSTSFAGVVQGTPMRVASDDVVGHTSSASLRSNSSQPLVPSPPITSKPDMVSPRISRMMSRKTSNGSGNGSGNSRGSFGSANDMSPTASMEIVKLASNSSHGWVSSPTSSVKFLPPIDARASKASNRSDDSGTKRRPRTAESAGSQTGSVGSGSSSKSQAKPTVVEIRRSGSGDLRIDGSSSGLVGVKSTSSASSPKQAVVGF